jgi:hypothetical protein
VVGEVVLSCVVDPRSITGEELHGLPELAVGRQGAFVIGVEPRLGEALSTIDPRVEFGVSLGEVCLEAMVKGGVEGEGGLEGGVVGNNAREGREAQEKGEQEAWHPPSGRLLREGGPALPCD